MNSCGSIRTAVGGDENSKSILSVVANLLVFILSTITHYANTSGGGTDCRSNTGTPNCGNANTSSCGTGTTGTSQPNICKQTPATAVVQQPETNHCNIVQKQTQPTAQNDNKCILKEFCDKVNKNASGKCKVLEEIKKECEKYNICRECMGSDEKCKEFIKVTMEYCKEEAKNIILQLNEDLSPELVNLIVLRFIGLQLYLRIIQEFCLLRDYFTKIIDNLTTCCDTIKSCTCGDNITRCCSIKGKCICTIFYKLFKAIRFLHNRYCKIIKYMNGESDEDLYKIIPSLSLTRSIIIITSYFKEYIDSDYMVEEDKCTCKEKKTCPKQSLPKLVGDILFNTFMGILSIVTSVKDGDCPCHKYSSKLDDVVTLLLGGIEDTDDCDGLLSDVISMMSSLVKVEDCRYEKMNNTPSTTNKDAIDKKLELINKEKDNLSTAITGINGETSCGGTAAGSGGVCTDSTAQGSQAGQTTNGCNGTIAAACGKYTNGASTSCGGQSDTTTCECNCAACRNVRVEWTCQPGRTDLSEWSGNNM